MEGTDGASLYGSVPVRISVRQDVDANVEVVKILRRHETCNILTLTGITSKGNSFELDLSCRFLRKGSHESAQFILHHVVSLMSQTFLNIITQSHCSYRKRYPRSSGGF